MKSTHVGKVTGGIFFHQSSVTKDIAKLEGKTIEVTVGEYKNKASNKQKRYYWGVVVPHVINMFKTHGTQVDKDETHEYLKKNIGRMFVLKRDLEGNKCVIATSIARLTTSGMEDYLEKIRVWASEFGYEIPLPNEEGYDEWVKKQIEKESKNGVTK